MIPLVDAHAHTGGEREMRARREILTVLCGTEPKSAAEVLQRRSERCIASCGLHPWNAERFSVDEMKPFIGQSAFLGEIGLDSVWTDADMDAQRSAFHAQLDVAEALCKPVVLHTKGMEEEIGRTLERYELTKIVHWYSCERHLGLYLSQDCYFTVGPDCRTNPAVRQVIDCAPLDRLLTETDGMDAVSWAMNRAVPPEEIEDVLCAELREIARIKGLHEKTVRQAVYDNLLTLMQGR